MKVFVPGESLIRHRKIDEIRDERGQAIEAAKGFEAMFTKFLYKQIGSGVQQEDITGTVSNGRKMFNDMLTEKYAELATENNSLGIADLILKGMGFEPERTGASLIGKSFKQPLDGLITSDFGERTHPITGAKTYHYGVDIKPNSDDPESFKIKAPLPGRVIFSGEYQNYGNVILLEHPGGYRTLYAHNEENQVKLGQFVKKGDIIGIVGSTGASTGKHLHFEVRKGITPIDPSILL